LLQEILNIGIRVLGTNRCMTFKKEIAKPSPSRYYRTTERVTIFFLKKVYNSPQARQ